MGKDYYEVLGVSKDADEDQLKKGARRSHCCDCITSPVLTSYQEMCSPPYHSAVSLSWHTIGITISDTFISCDAAYRKLAMKWHPDKNQGDACGSVAVYYS